MRSVLLLGYPCQILLDLPDVRVCGIEYPRAHCSERLIRHRITFAWQEFLERFHRIKERLDLRIAFPPCEELEFAERDRDLWFVVRICELLGLFLVQPLCKVFVWVDL